MVYKPVTLSDSVSEGSDPQPESADVLNVIRLRRCLARKLKTAHIWTRMALPPPLSSSLSFVENMHTVSGAAGELQFERDDIIFLRGLRLAFSTAMSNANVTNDPSSSNAFDQEKRFLSSHEGPIGHMQDHTATKLGEDVNEKGEFSYAEPEEIPSKAELDIYKEFRSRYNEFKEEIHSLSTQFASVGGSQFIVQKSKSVENTLTRLQQIIHKLVFNSELDDIQGDLRQMEAGLQSFVDSVEALQYSLSSFKEHHGSLLLKVALGKSHIQTALFELSKDNNWLSSMTVNRRQKERHQRVAIMTKVRDRQLHCTMSSLASGLSLIAKDIRSILPIALLSLRNSEENSISRYLALTTIAIFFSSVAATTLQFSYEATDTALSQFVNGFWFLSLLFSIASAVNSLLGMTWRRSRIAPPAYEPPAWLNIVLKHAPMIYLIISAVCYALGLCLFAYLSQQSMAIQIITTIFIACHIILLAVASIWFLIISSRDMIVGLPTKGRAPFTSIRDFLKRGSPRLRSIDNADTEAINTTNQSQILTNTDSIEDNTSVRTYQPPQRSSARSSSRKQMTDSTLVGIVGLGGGGVPSGQPQSCRVLRNNFRASDKTPGTSEGEGGKFADSIHHS